MCSKSIKSPNFGSGTRMRQLGENANDFGFGTLWVKSPENLSSLNQKLETKVKISPNGSSNSSFCRICHDGDGLETLVSPCKCTGTLALIHASCLEHWLTSSNTDKCEICKHPFQTTREPRSYSEYIHDSSNQFNVRNMVADVVCFFLLTPLLIISTYLCVLGAHQYFLRERWEAIGLVILALFLLSVYYTWCHVTLKFHLTVWNSWQETNQRVRLVEVITNREYRESTHESMGQISRTTNNVTTPLIPATSTDVQCPIPNEEEELYESDTRRIII